MKRYFSAFILAILAVVLAAGIYGLFELRFESGDVYPPYSSLRADPLGTMVFYESLEGLPDFSVQRDYSTINRLPKSPKTAYLHLAATMEMWKHIPEKDFHEIDRFVNDGGRLVIALLPAPAEFVRQRSEEEKKEEKKAEEKDANDEPPPKDISIVDHWKLNSRVVNLAANKKSEYQPAQVRNVSGLSLPSTLAWHSGIVFTDLDPEWKPIFMRDADAVVVERHFGNGTVVFTSDSYFLSNEAMLNDRHPDLLSWIIGPQRTIVFDEAHLGVTESANIATLMRRYRLHWLAASFILLAGLFVWKNGFSLAPDFADDRAPAFVTGKESSEGFVNLLRRSIPASDLLSVCFNEWKKSTAHGAKHASSASGRQVQAQTAFDNETSKTAKDRDPVQTYQSISRILQKRTP